MNDFSRKFIRDLAKQGIYLIGTQAIPDMESEMPYANAQRGYKVNDNGTGKVLTYQEIVSMVK